VDEQDQGLMLALFRLSFARPDRLDPEVAAHPAYLLFAMGRDRSVRVKPQNLIAGLPLAGARAA
jgi:hypothetical protein